MRIRKSLRNLTMAAVCAALAACGSPSSKEEGISREEQDLRKQSEAFNRTLVEATAAGALLGGTFGLAFGGEDKVDDGIAIGALAGLAAGSYVGHLQKRYASDEARLEKLREDVEAANAEAEAALANMRRVRDQQLAQLAEARASNDAAALRAETQQANANREEMDKLITGAEKQYSEFRSTRALTLVQGQETGVDPQLQELQGRIQAMKAIAATLAAEV